MVTGLVFPLVRPAEVLVDTPAALLCVAGEEEGGGGGWMRRGEVVLDATGEEEEERGRRRREGGVCLGGDVLGAPGGEGRMGREYVRRAAVAVVVSLGGAGTRMWGDGANAAAAAAALGAWPAETEGAGVRGGGGEEVVGVSVGAGESSSMGLGVSRGGVGVESGAAALLPLAASPRSDWLWRTGSRSMLTLWRSPPARVIGVVLQVIPGAVHPGRNACSGGVRVSGEGPVVSGVIVMSCSGGSSGVDRLERGVYEASLPRLTAHELRSTKRSRSSPRTPRHEETLRERRRRSSSL